MYEVERKSLEIEIAGKTFKLLERSMIDQRAMDQIKETGVDQMLLILADALKNNYENLSPLNKDKRYYKYLLSPRGLNKNLSVRQVQVLYVKLLCMEGLMFDTCKECGNPVEKKSLESPLVPE